MRANINKPMQNAMTEDQKIGWVDWKKGLERSVYPGIEIKAIMIPIEHGVGGLSETILQFVNGEDNDNLNIEQVYAFPLKPDLALALLVFNPNDWPVVAKRFDLANVVL